MLWHGQNVTEKLLSTCNISDLYRAFMRCPSISAILNVRHYEPYDKNARPRIVKNGLLSGI